MLGMIDRVHYFKNFLVDLGIAKTISDFSFHKITDEEAVPITSHKLTDKVDGLFACVEFNIAHFQSPWLIVKDDEGDAPANLAVFGKIGSKLGAVEIKAVAKRGWEALRKNAGGKRKIRGVCAKAMNFNFDGVVFIDEHFFSPLFSFFRLSIKPHTLTGVNT